VRVPEGGTAYGVVRGTPAGRAQFDLGAEISAERLAGDPARWRVVLARGADVLATSDLGLGERLERGDRRFELTAAVPGGGAGRFLVSVAGASARAVALGDRIESGGRGDLAVVGYDPNRGGDGPALEVAWLRPGERPERGWVFGRYPEFDERVRRSSPPVQVLGFERRLELRIRVEQPGGRWLIALGALGVVIGVLLFASPPHARIAARPADGGWEIRGEAVRGAPDLARDVDAIADALRASAARARREGRA
jgi:hypothetical protein